MDEAPRLSILETVPEWVGLVVLTIVALVIVVPLLMMQFVWTWRGIRAAWRGE